MGLLDRAKRLFGIGASTPEEDFAATEDGEKHRPEAPREKAVRAERGGPAGRAGGRRRPVRDRPPLGEAPPPSQTIEDALVAREAGDRAEARKILREIDRGAGLRTVLRAAAALEESDAEELSELLPLVAREEPGWRLLLQMAAALEDATAARPYIERAARHGAPAWALAWTRVLSVDETTRREGLVELLFSDAPLARTVAARDLEVSGVEADPEAAQRYASFAHGREMIRRFGAKMVADLIDRAARIGGP